MSEQIGSGTAKGLVEFLDSLVEKGRGPKNAVRHLRTSFIKVMEAVDGDQWEKTNIREVNVEDYMRRFSNLTMGTYKEDSLVVYGSRVRKVIRWYLLFLSKPGWAPTFGRAKSTSKANAPFADKLSAVETDKKNDNIGPTLDPTDVGVRPKGRGASDGAASDLIAYPFPLNDGGLVTLYLPLGLTKGDSIRLSNFLATLVVNEDNQHGT